MGVTNSIMATRDEAKATEVLTSLFQKVDVNANGALCLSELKRVFGEHAGQFLTFCDGDDDKEISVDEWLKGILGDTADLSEEEFQATWVERMGGCVAAAEGATLGGQTLAEIVALTPAQLVALGLSEDLAGEKASLFVAAANRLLAMGIAPETPANGFYVPGRIEVMGKHTDYAGGRSLLAAASKSFCVVSTNRDDNKCRIFTNRTGTTDPEELAALAACTEDSENQATLELSANLETDSAWANYPAMTLRRLCRNFGEELKGVDMAIECDIPEASGMSTSSAMICTMFVVMDARNNLQALPLFKEHLKTKEDLYGYLGNCENGQNFNDVLTGDKGVGTFGGSEDHTAIMSCKGLSLNMFSYCPTQFLENVAFPEDLTFVIASSGAVAEKTGAAMGSYNNAAFLARDCTGAWNKATNNTAAFLAQACSQAEGSHDEKFESMKAEIAKFDNADFPEVEGEAKWPAGVLVPRFEQFYRESEVMVPAFAEALKANDQAALATVAEESQRRTDEQLKNLVPETQWLPQAARENGAIAASAFGAGFGGSVWAIVEKTKAADFMATWKAAYEGKFEAAKNPACRFFTMVPGPGAFSLQGQRWSVDS